MQLRRVFVAAIIIISLNFIHITLNYTPRKNCKIAEEEISLKKSLLIFYNSIIFFIYLICILSTISLIQTRTLEKNFFNKFLFYFIFLPYFVNPFLPLASEPRNHTPHLKPIKLQNESMFSKLGPHV